MANLKASVRQQAAKQKSRIFAAIHQGARFLVTVDPGADPVSTAARDQIDRADDVSGKPLRGTTHLAKETKKMPHDHPHNKPMSDVELRVKALESILTEKELIDPEAIDLIVETYETKIGPRNGARVVAKARSDPAYKDR